MSRFWHRILAALTPGVRLLIGSLAAIYLAAVIGEWLHAFDLYGWLALSGPKFWHGQIWRLVTYAWLPAGILDLLLNCLVLLLIGGQLERHWTRGELWSYCLVAAAGAGVAKVLPPFSNSQPLAGPAPMLFGLIVGWGFLCGREQITIPPFGETTVGKLVLVVGAGILLGSFFTAGITAAIILSAGGFAGWLYLWLKHKWLMNLASRAATSERMRRLEL